MGARQAPRKPSALRVLWQRAEAEASAEVPDERVLLHVDALDVLGDPLVEVELVKLPLAQRALVIAAAAVWARRLGLCLILELLDGRRLQMVHLPDAFAAIGMDLLVFRPVRSSCAGTLRGAGLEVSQPLDHPAIRVREKIRRDIQRRRLSDELLQARLPIAHAHGLQLERGEWEGVGGRVRN
eukprot:1051141-Pyramimonas_sp.AAC.1